MLGVPLMIKILVLATLLLGSLVLLSNFLIPGPRNLRTRRNGGAPGKSRAIAATFTGPERSDALAADGKFRQTEEQWKAELTEDQYQVTRCGATERPFTGRYWNMREDGSYMCVGCGQELFSSDAKYDAGTGWPSY